MKRRLLYVSTVILLCLGGSVGYYWWSQSDAPPSPQQNENEILISNGCRYVDGRLVPPEWHVGIPGMRVRCKEYYQELPLFEQYPPIATIPANPDISPKWTSMLTDFLEEDETCVAMTIGDYPSWKTNICNINVEIGLRNILHGFAPALVKEQMFFWVAEMNGDSTPELILGYVIEREDPYVAYWTLVQDSQGAIHPRFLGTYLLGHLHAVDYFGTAGRMQTVFIRHQSCTECTPVVYLTAVTPNHAQNKPYLFSYNGNRTWNPTIEYELPGEDHSIAAVVETRLPSTQNRKGPHLLQFFERQDGAPNEWWIFTCRRNKCRTQVHMEALPNEYRSAWDQGKKL